MTVFLTTVTQLDMQHEESPTMTLTYISIFWHCPPVALEAELDMQTILMGDLNV